ncbi:glycosyltransferase family 2 protein [Colwellia sp. RE-S-Sl-9]
MTSKLSAVIPLFNKSQYIKRAIESILNQNHPVDEIIIVDDGSTDNSVEIVNSIKSNKLKIISQKNQGVSSARNNGIKNASNEYVLLIDADDIWLPHFTTEIIKLIKAYPTAGMFATAYSFIKFKKITPANLRFVPKDSGLIQNYFLSCIKADLPVTASSVAIKKEAFYQVGGFIQGMAMGEDQLLWSRIAYKYPIAFSNTISVYYDISIANSACKTHIITSLAPHISYWTEDLKNEEVPNNFRNSLKQLLHFSALYCVKNNLKVNNKKQARKILFNEPTLLKDSYWFISIFLTFLPYFIIKRIF